MTSEPLTSGRCLADFEGTWTLSRRIIHEDGPVAAFEGEARWQPSGGGLDYSETGQLRMPGHAPINATRRYRWEEGLRVFFEDGRFFHAVPARGGQAHHWCDPDDYRVTYDFADWPVFTTTWAVRGPRKAYRMISRYVRADV
ncbi:MAG: trigger factor [Rhodobacteraceae bacterium]|nr:MAG: trigger factor [Paracoccaceae bacterium]